jgi:hypothetical protein
MNSKCIQNLNVKLKLLDGNTGVNLYDLGLWFLAYDNRSTSNKIKKIDKPDIIKIQNTIL